MIQSVVAAAVFVSFCSGFYGVALLIGPRPWYTWIGIGFVYQFIFTMALAGLLQVFGEGL